MVTTERAELEGRVEAARATGSGFTRTTENGTEILKKSGSFTNFVSDRMGGRIPTKPTPFTKREFRVLPSGKIISITRDVRVTQQDRSIQTFSPFESKRLVSEGEEIRLTTRFPKGIGRGFETESSKTVGTRVVSQPERLRPRKPIEGGQIIARTPEGIPIKRGAVRTLDGRVVEQERGFFREGVRFKTPEAALKGELFFETERGAIRRDIREEIPKGVKRITEREFLNIRAEAISPIEAKEEIETKEQFQEKLAKEFFGKLKTLEGKPREFVEIDKGIIGVETQIGGRRQIIDIGAVGLRLPKPRKEELTELQRLRGIKPKELKPELDLVPSGFLERKIIKAEIPISARVDVGRLGVEAKRQEKARQKEVSRQLSKLAEPLPKAPVLEQDQPFLKGLQTKIGERFEKREKEFQELGKFLVAEKEIPTITEKKLRTLQFKTGLTFVGLKALKGFAAPFVHPVETVKGFKRLVTEPVQVFREQKELFRQEPTGFVAETAGGFLAFKGISKVARAGVKRIPISGEAIKVKIAGEKFTIRTVGLELPQRGRGVPLITGRVPKITKLREGFIDIGKPAARFKLEQLGEAIPAPRRAVGAKALGRVLGISPKEVARIQAIQQISRQLGKEKGAVVERAFFDIKEIAKPEKVSKIFIEEIGKGEGVIFGTATTQQLPKGFRIRPGDIDVFFPVKTEVQISKIVRRTTGRLQRIGEKVRVSEKNPLVIETTKGLKIFEAKAGIDPTKLSIGESPAAVGGLGFDFPDIKARRIGKTVPFGEAEAITAGEQLTRKGVASAFFRGREAVPKEIGKVKVPKTFEEPGIFPIGRRIKDIPGFVIQAKGLIELRKGVRGFLAERGVKRFIETFKPEQQAFIERAAKGLVGEKIPFEFKPPKPKKVGIIDRDISPFVAEVSRFRVPTREIPPSIFEKGVDVSISPKPRRAISPIISPGRVVSPSKLSSRLAKAYGLSPSAISKAPSISRGLPSTISRPPSAISRPPSDISRLPSPSKLESSISKALSPSDISSSLRSDISSVSRVGSKISSSFFDGVRIPPPPPPPPFFLDDFDFKKKKKKKKRKIIPRIFRRTPTLFEAEFRVEKLRIPGLVKEDIALFTGFEIERFGRGAPKRVIPKRKGKKKR